MKKLQDKENSGSWLFKVLAVLFVSIVITGCCTSFPIPGTSGRPAEPGTIDQHGNPAPTDAICASGEKCADPGKGCGLFPYKDVCTNVWNSETNECSCECEYESD